MSTITKRNLIIDLAIFAGFLIANQPSLTGETIHEWFSLALGAALLTHVALHWDWIINVAITYFKRLFHESRLNFIVDILIFGAFTAVIFSGIMISRSLLAWTGLSLNASPAWRSIHKLAADLSLILTALHFGLHWKWFVCVFNTYILGRTPDASQPTPKEGLVINTVEIDQ